jgi:uncharacterized membrane protein YdjX (TVP38/TMEM64 family)
MFHTLSLKVRWGLALLLAGAGIAGVLWLTRGPDFLSTLWHAKDQLIEWCRAYPIVLFAALVVLPAFGCPASALLVLAGVTWGSNWRSCALSVFAMFLNMTWTYLVAAGPARALVARLLGRHWDRWRNLEHKDRIRLTVLLRVTPGVPLFLQNYVLGLVAVPFLPYIVISVPINGVFVVGFVLTSGAVFEGRFGMAITGIAVLVAAFVLVRLLRARVKPARPELPGEVIET